MIKNIILESNSVSLNCIIITQVDENLRLLMGNKVDEGKYMNTILHHIVGPNFSTKLFGNVLLDKIGYYKLINDVGEIVPNCSRIPFVEIILSETESVEIFYFINSKSSFKLFKFVQNRLKGIDGFSIYDDSIVSPNGYCDIVP